MKNISLLTLVLANFVWEAVAADPTLSRLQNSYQDAAKRALAPIQATYQKELTRLFEEYTKGGKASAALEVRNEMLKQGFDLPQTAGASALTTEAFLRKKLIKGRYVFYFDPPRSKLLAFDPGGKIEEGAAGQEQTWKVEGNELLIFSQTNQLSHALEYVPATDSFKVSPRSTLFMSRKVYMENEPQK